MMELLASLENTTVATWVRTSSSILGYPTVLTLHTLGLGILVGASWVLDLRILGFASAIPLSAFLRTFRVMWVGFWINTASGLLLFAADATTKGATLLFMSKLALIAVGVATIPLIRRAVFDGGAGSDVVSPRARRLALVSLGVWTAAIAAGRLMAYL